jgi:hypothetical protein
LGVGHDAEAEDQREYEIGRVVHFVENIECRRGVVDEIVEVGCCRT